MLGYVRGPGSPPFSVKKILEITELLPTLYVNYRDKPFLTRFLPLT